MKLKELLKEAKELNYSDNIPLFDWIYFVPQRRKHDSGYNIMEIYGVIFNSKTLEEKIYKLSSISDVIDFEKIIITEKRRILSIDIPEYNIIRMFPRNNKKFKVEFLNISSFNIEIV